jgi:hypothetical protein
MTHRGIWQAASAEITVEVDQRKLQEQGPRHIAKGTVCIDGSKAKPRIEVPDGRRTFDVWRVRPNSVVSERFEKR